MSHARAPLGNVFKRRPERAILALLGCVDFDRLGRFLVWRRPLSNSWSGFEQDLSMCVWDVLDAGRHM